MNRYISKKMGMAFISVLFVSTMAFAVTFSWDKYDDAYGRTWLRHNQASGDYVDMQGANLVLGTTSGIRADLNTNAEVGFHQNEANNGLASAIGSGSMQLSWSNSDTPGGAGGPLDLNGPFNYVNGMRIYTGPNTPSSYEPVATWQNGVYSDFGETYFTPTTAGVSVPSDARLKADVVDTKTDALGVVCGVPVRDYTVKDNGANGTGFVAQELMARYPKAVVEIDGVYVIKQEDLLPMLWESLRDLDARLSAME